MVAVSYPGVYIEEIPSGVRTITGVPTSITAFLGRTRTGPINEPIIINSFGDFERQFGGLDVNLPLSYAVRGFYLNGGSQAIIVRLYKPSGGAGAGGAAAGGAGAGGAGAGGAGAGGAGAGGAGAGGAGAGGAAAGGAGAGGAAAGGAAAAPEGAAEATPSDGVARFKLDDLSLAASSPGAWANDMQAAIDPEVSPEVRDRLGLGKDDALFNLTLKSGEANEKFLNLTVTNNARRIDRVLNTESNLVRWDGVWPSTPLAMGKLAAARTPWDTLQELLRSSTPDEEAIKKARQDYETAAKELCDDVGKAQQTVDEAQKKLDDALRKGDATAIDAAKKALAAAQDSLKTAQGGRKGSESQPLDEGAYEGSEADKTGIFALNKADLFNLLCIPPDTREGDDVPPSVLQFAMTYCATRRAMLIVDSPAVWSANQETAANDAEKGLLNFALTGTDARNAALFFPRVLQTDPLRDGQLDKFAPCGIVAGVMARTDNTRGVWKAPAGLDASLSGIQGLDVNLNDPENGLLNPLGINCLRSFPVYGRVVWGSRTLRGADQLADEWKYVPVRRTALFIEESLYRGTKWVVFEPNDEPLWAQIRLNIGAFMHNLFRQGAFQGQTPREAYFVKCDKETTTQNDINLGIVNIVVGFAPLKPAEFVIIKLQQIAGQIEV
jgi:hypothetical protein